jgi:hypothetical protein
MVDTEEKEVSDSALSTCRGGYAPPSLVEEPDASDRECRSWLIVDSRRRRSRSADENGIGRGSILLPSVLFVVYVYGSGR